MDVYEKEAEVAVALRSGRLGQPDLPRKSVGRGGSPAPSIPIVKLMGRPNVILTPHNSFNTVEAVDRKTEQTIQQLEHFLQKGEFLWPVPSNSRP